ncbi:MULTISPECIES: hypothetical protein [Pseudoalteromonas]|uniref:hypothetical protein n=1 Tax=Pseudoalteromonas TaxID=53246 RepID=UPI001891D74B|nr:MULTISPECIES: hypothetical protein [Pseudoalteromonas]MCG7563062.1 hypothetical protein [Pseudoalteromonas sp. McH1-42]MEC4091672.1 hypothetical protein [Pseudoalteromonas rubra]
MKQLLISTALLVSGTFCFSSHASNLDPELQTKLDDTFYLYDSGHYQETLDNVQWLVKKGVAVDYDFYGYRLGVVLSLWRNLAQDFEPARISFNQFLESSVQKAVNSPQNCAAFDDARSMLRLQHRVTDIIATLEEKEAAHPQVWSRCWDDTATLDAVEQTSKPLIDAYIGDLSDHFAAHYIPNIEQYYNQCSTEGDYREACQDGVKEYLTSVSNAFRHAAMTHYGLNEAGQVGGLTLSLLLKWQEQNN